MVDVLLSVNRDKSSNFYSTISYTWIQQRVFKVNGGVNIYIYKISIHVQTL